MPVTAALTAAMRQATLPGMFPVTVPAACSAPPGDAPAFRSGTPAGLPAALLTGCMVFVLLAAWSWGWRLTPDEELTMRLQAAWALAYGDGAVFAPGSDRWPLATWLLAAWLRAVPVAGSWRWLGPVVAAGGSAALMLLAVRWFRCRVTGAVAVLLLLCTWPLTAAVLLPSAYLWLALLVSAFSACLAGALPPGNGRLCRLLTAGVLAGGAFLTHRQGAVCVAALLLLAGYRLVRAPRAALPVLAAAALALLLILPWWCGMPPAADAGTTAPAPPGHWEAAYAALVRLEAELRYPLMVPLAYAAVVTWGHPLLQAVALPMGLWLAAVAVLALSPATLAGSFLCFLPLLMLFSAHGIVRGTRRLLVPGTWPRRLWCGLLLAAAAYFLAECFLRARKEAVVRSETRARAVAVQPVAARDGLSYIRAAEGSGRRGPCERC